MCTSLILECPFCGENGDNIMMYAFSEKERFCYCPCCNMQGPVAPVDERAIQFWNELPRRQQWFSETPKVSGYYFIREKDSRNNNLFYFSEQGYFLNGNRKINLNDLIDFEFLGPINPYDALKTKDAS